VGGDPHFALDALKGHRGIHTQSQLLLELQDPQDRFVDAGLGQAPGADRVHDPPDRRLHVRRHEDHVGSGLHRPHRRLLPLEPPVDGVHVHGVGEDQPVESQVPSEEVGEGPLREGRRHAVVAGEGGHGDVGRHDAPHPLVDGGPERHQLHRVQAGPIHFDQG
jgi:hypothetical protein